MADTKRGNWAERGAAILSAPEVFVLVLFDDFHLLTRSTPFLHTTGGVVLMASNLPHCDFQVCFRAFVLPNVFSLWCFIGGPWLVWQQNTDVQTLEVAHALLPRVKYSFKSKTKAEKWLFDRSSLRPSCIHYVHRLKQKSALTQNVKHKQNIQTIVVRNTWGCKRLTPIQKR